MSALAALDEMGHAAAIRDGNRLINAWQYLVDENGVTEAMRLVRTRPDGEILLATITSLMLGITHS